MEDSWLSWTRHNLERQCAPSEIRQILLNNGFTVDEIRAAMGTAYPLGAENIESASLADVAITWPESGAVRFNSDAIQLYTVEDFLKSAECDELARIINRNLRPSTVTLNSKDEYFRTSSTCYLSESDAPIVLNVERKIVNTMGINPSYSEPIQGQKYLPGQQFKAHTDFFEPHSDEYRHHCQDKGNRTWTFMIYLTNVKEGGGTAFPAIGKTFLPQKGMALAWNNLDRAGNPNRSSIHSGEPVVMGEKLIITKWFRERGVGELFR